MVPCIWRGLGVQCVLLIFLSPCCCAPGILKKKTNPGPEVSTFETFVQNATDIHQTLTEMFTSQQPH